MLVEGCEGSRGFCCLVRFAFLLEDCSGPPGVAGTLVESGGRCWGPPVDTGDLLVEMDIGSPWLSKVTRAFSMASSSRALSDHDELEEAAVGVASSRGFCE